MARVCHCALPVIGRPEATEGRQGFCHRCQMYGDVTEAKLGYILRDHDAAKLQFKKDNMQDIADYLNGKYGAGTVEVEIKDSYRNMLEKIKPHFHLIETARKAVRMAGLEPVEVPVRRRRVAVGWWGGCGEPFSPKVVRATGGAGCRLPGVTLPVAGAAERLHRNGLPLYAAALQEDSGPLSSVSLSKAAVIIGSEGKGVTEQALRLADKRVIIPMKGRAESLNAGVAAAIVIYEMTK